MKGARVFQVSGASPAGKALTEDPRWRAVVHMGVEENSTDPMAAAVEEGFMVAEVEEVAGKDFYFVKTGVVTGNIS